MERPWIAGWELTTNEKGVEMATLPAQLLRDTLAYIEKLEQQCNIADVSVSLPSDPMVLAKYLHDNYEQIAKRANWNTQKDCKVEFEDLPTENKNTMILLAGKLILDFVGNER